MEKVEEVVVEEEEEEKEERRKRTTRREGEEGEEERRKTGGEGDRDTSSKLQVTFHNCKKQLLAAHRAVGNSVPYKSEVRRKQTT